MISKLSDSFYHSGNHILCATMFHFLLVNHQWMVYDYVWRHQYPLMNVKLLELSYHSDNHILHVTVSHFLLVSQQCMMHGYVG